LAAGIQLLPMGPEHFSSFVNGCMSHKKVTTAPAGRFAGFALNQADQVPDAMAHIPSGAWGEAVTVNSINIYGISHSVVKGGIEVVSREGRN
jgi:hypothetical protein